MNSFRGYCLNKGVQVRREKFGLLFYNYRGPRLYFVPSQDLIEERFFSGSEPIEALVKGAPSWIQERIFEIMNRLEAKGLIHEQPIC